jgi:hypothetical protein
LSLINDNEDEKLKKNIQLSIEKRNEAVNDIINNDNAVDIQLSKKLQTTVQPMKPTRKRQLPIKYR